MSDETDRCYLSALRILNVRFNSEAELRRKLAAKQFDRDVIDGTLDRLRREKWLDDERFAAAFVRMRVRKGTGRIRIRRELTAAGVSDEIASAALAANGDAGREQESLVALCTKKIAIIARRHGTEYVRSDQGRKKLVAYLLNQGYEMAAVLDTIRQSLRTLGE
ncbi:MAG: regulatory protein RecX [Thermoanaerobaculia bacterium]